MKKKLVLKALLFGVLIFISFIVSLQFPKIYIPKIFSYKTFNVYSSEKTLVSEDVVEKLDSVILNIQKSEFYNQGQSFDLFFIKGSFYAKAIKCMGVKNIASSKFDTHIYIGEPDFKKGWLVKGDSKLERVNLVQIISHESVHSQMYPNYSSFGLMQTPSWVNEGYCEYISYAPKRKQNNQSICILLQLLEESEDQWLLTPYKNYSPRFYILSRLIIEYLLDVKNYSITTVIENNIEDQDSIYNEIKIWCNNREHY